MYYIKPENISSKYAKLYSFLLYIYLLYILTLFESLLN